MASMTRRIGASILAMGLLFAGSAAPNAAAAPSQAASQKLQPSQATDLSARRRNPHPARYAYRPASQPTYYDRPSDYRPYPYAAPLPFFLGFGFLPRW
jgi:hypothetical protein